MLFQYLLFEEFNVETNSPHKTRKQVKYDEICENVQLVPNKKNSISERASDGEKSEMNYFKEICQGN